MFKYLLTSLYWIAYFDEVSDIYDEPGHSADMGPDPKDLSMLQKCQFRLSFNVIIVFLEGNCLTRRGPVSDSSGG